MRMLDLIAKKRGGAEHEPSELAFIARAAADSSVPDYQLSAWLMAALLNGMTEKETVSLTRAMADSGRTLRLAGGRAVDKHSTGGVGDGVSLALAPMAAAAGLTVPMMSGRGLGHTGGTLDKLEAIPGMKVRLPVARIERQLKSIGVAMFGQSDDLNPADRKLYALRDATATVESMPLIVASILSKKVAENLDGLVMDVKYGSGAFLPDPKDAAELGRRLVSTAKGLGLKCVGLVTAMEEPLGRAIGNASEMRQAIQVLHGDRSFPDYSFVLDVLGGWMAVLGGKARTPEAGARLMTETIYSGRALKALKDMVRAQGGDVRVVDDPSRLKDAPLSRSVRSPARGRVTRLDARIIGAAAVALGAGRATMDDAIDHGAGILLKRKVGYRVEKGEEIARLFASDPARLAAGERIFKTAVSVGSKMPAAKPLIWKVIR